MKRLLLHAILLSIGCAGIYTPAQGQEEKVTDVIIRKFEVGEAPVISIKGHFGPISISGVEGTTAFVVTTVSGIASDKKSAEKLIRKVKVKLDGSDGYLRIETFGPNDSRNFDGHGYEISIRVSVPRESIVHVENKFGMITASDLFGTLDLKGRHGSVEVRGAKNVSVKNAFGSVHVSDVWETATIENKHGSVRCYHARNCKIQNEFGPVEVEDIHEHADIQGQAGSIDAKEIGSGNIRNRMGSVTIQLGESFDGKLVLRAHSGTITTNTGLPVTEVPKGAKTRGHSSLKGTLGKGAGLVSVSVDMGSITVDR